MINPVINDLKVQNLIVKKRCILLSNKVRNDKIKVFKDLNSKVIFLDKYNIKKNYYEKKYSQEIIKYKKTSYSINNNDNCRRYAKIKKYLNKNINFLDFGCGDGSFLKKIYRHKKLNKIYGLEIRDLTLKKFKHHKKIRLVKNLNELKITFDIITLFHVFHYMPNQLSLLKKLYKMLNRGGLIFIEIPNANDVLFKISSFLKFTLCKESLVWHTKKSISSFLKKNKFNSIKVNFFQRYNLNNHLNWLLNDRASGNRFMQKFIKKKIQDGYENFLKKKENTNNI